MSRHRHRGWAALGAAALLTGTMLAGSGAANAAQAEVFLEVTPNTVQAGERVAIRANCGGDHVNSATVRSRAFAGNGRLMVLPDQSGLITEQADVASGTRPGEYTVTLECAGRASVAVDLFVLDMARPTRGPATGGGGTADTGGGGAAPLILATGVVAVAGAAGLLLRGRRRAA